MKMDEELNEKADKVINAGVASALGGAAIPLPVADSVAISLAQVTMLYTLSRVYGRSVDKEFFISLLYVFGAAKFGEWMWSLVKVIPGFGTAAGIIGQMAIAGGVTFALGQAGKSLFSTDKPITKDSFKKSFDENKKSADEKYREIEKQKEAYKKVLNEINFNVDKQKIDNKLVLKFNLQNAKEPRIRILHESGEFQKDLSLRGVKTQKTLDFSSYPKGAYFVTLVGKNFPDIGITVEKV